MGARKRMLKPLTLVFAPIVWNILRPKGFAQGGANISQLLTENAFS